jgi:O-methyltransferase
MAVGTTHTHFHTGAVVGLHCPSAAEMAQAALGQLSAPEQQNVRDHVAHCPSCAKTRNQLVEQLAGWSGRFLYKGHLIWPNDWTWLESYKKYLGPDGAGGQPKTRIIDRRFTLIQLAKAVRHVRGSTGECGVLGGVGSAMICKTLEGTYAENEFHWGFDSFEGLSEPGEIDRTQHAWQRKGALAISPEVARKNLADFSFCKLVKGWIPKCFAPALDQRFRLAHIDLDLHEPTIQSLEYYYPRMNSGGVFVFDDYGHLTCLGVRAAINEYFAGKPERVIETVDGIAFAFKV